MITKIDAIQSLRPNSEWLVSGNNLQWLDATQTEPSEEELQEKIAELTAAEPMRLLRLERNQLLASTDWRMTTDYPYNDQPAWASYRTELRNLPATASPTLDEQGNLTNVDWPTLPSDL